MTGQARQSTKNFQVSEFFGFLRIALALVSLLCGHGFQASAETLENYVAKGFIPPSIAYTPDIERISPFPCYSKNCLIENFKPVLQLSSAMNEVLKYHAKEQLESTVRKLESSSKDALSQKELEPLLGSFLGKLPTLSYAGTESRRGPLEGRIVHILQSCDMSVDLLNRIRSKFDLKANGANGSGPIDIETAVLAGKAKCVYDLHGMMAFLTKSKVERCEKLVRDSLEIIDLKDGAGSYAALLTDIVIKNPKFDDYIVSFIHLIKSEILSAGNPITDATYFKNELKKHGKDPDESANHLPISHEIASEFLAKRKVDLGEIALRATHGNAQDAVLLLQLVASDPGGYFIPWQLGYRLRKEDPIRAVRLDEYLEQQKSVLQQPILPVIGKDAPLLFGRAFSHNWSKRNYKMLAGMVLGMELSKRGYSENEAAWAAQFTGEAYRVSYLLKSENREKEKPYFETDSTAHYVGGRVGALLGSGKSLQDAMVNFEAYYKDGSKSAQQDWNRMTGAAEIWDSAETIKRFLRKDPDR